MVYTDKIVFQQRCGNSTGLDHEYSTTMAAQRYQQQSKSCNVMLQHQQGSLPTTMLLKQHQQQQPIMFLRQQPTTIMRQPPMQQYQQKQFYNALSPEAKVTLSRDTLANKLRENWQRQPQTQTDSINLDDSLTSLGWLHGMNVMKSVTSPTPPPSPMSDDVQQDVNPNAILTTISNIQPKKPSYGMMYHTSLDKIDYTSNPYVKPPYSYATLICMAIKENGVEKITLSSIYQWITDNFMYYRLADPSWQNSIRHNLSLNKCFQKVPRRKDEPGKGGFWRINPEYNDMLVDGVLKKRRSTIPINYHPAKKIKTEPDDPWGKDRPDPIPEFHPDKQFVPNEVSAKDLRNGNYSLNQLLNQDIMVGGVQVKTEDIIDDNLKCLDEGKEPTDVTFGDITPPSSGNSNSDNSLDEIFNFNDEFQNSPLDLSTSALDLCVQGVELKPPDWWMTDCNSPAPQGGLHTPVHDQDSLDDWSNTRLSVEEAIAAFDIDNLFESSS